MNNKSLVRIGSPHFPYEHLVSPRRWYYLLPGLVSLVGWGILAFSFLPKQGFSTMSMVAASSALLLQSVTGFLVVNLSRKRKQARELMMVRFAMMRNYLSSVC
jgi:hypothetical protein